VDGESLKVDLTMAKALGGPGDKGKTNPEELFAAGTVVPPTFLSYI
jgi:organic hydroperoxide reductase OsmC/OhrA